MRRQSTLDWLIDDAYCAPDEATIALDEICVPTLNSAACLYGCDAELGASRLRFMSAKDIRAHYRDFFNIPHISLVDSVFGFDEPEEPQVALYCDEDAACDDSLADDYEDKSDRPIHPTHAEYDGWKLKLLEDFKATL